MRRHSALFTEALMEKAPKNMTIVECCNWLKANPLVDCGDVAYLLQVEKQLYDLLLPSASSNDSGGAAVGKHWDLPTWLHFIECVMDSRACEALARKFTSKTRLELDAANSEVCHSTFEEVVADLFNNKKNDYRSGF